MRNPFKNKARRESYDAVLKMYQDRHKTLFAKDGSRNYGNSFAAHFWLGYDGKTRGQANYSDRASRETGGYVFYRAGQDIAAREKSQ